MSDKDNELDDILSDKSIVENPALEVLEEQTKSSKPYKSQNERRKEKIEEYRLSLEEKKKTRAEIAAERLKNKAKRLRKTIKKRQENARARAYDKLIKEDVADLTPEQKAALIKNTVADPNYPKECKIGWDLEKVLFPYYSSGATLQAIHQQFGIKYGFNLTQLRSAAQFYAWEKRKHHIRMMVLSNNDKDIAERFSTYAGFLDNMISEAIIRFQMNSQNGNNNNPLNDLKIKNVKDLQTAIELMMNMMHGGVKKVEVSKKETQSKVNNTNADDMLTKLTGEENE